MRLRCSFCKIVFECETFEQVAMIQTQQCFITLRGITHKLSEYSIKGGIE